MKLLFAQANPDSKYGGTRHNVGVTLLNTFVERHNGEWKLKKAFHGHVSELSIGGEKIVCIKPTTYYNETSRSVRAIVDFYKLDPGSDVLVIHDDLALPFGTIRTRKKGSDAGNNGIKSINTAIGERYARLRVGIWSELRDRMDDATFVLSKFSKDESKIIDEITISEVLRIIEDFCRGDFIETSKTLLEK